MNLTPKLQRGAVFNFSRYKGLDVPKSSSKESSKTSTKASPKSDDDDDKGKLTEKDFFKMLEKLDGLDSDNNILTQLLMETFELARATKKESIGDLRVLYLSALNKIVSGKDNKKRFDDTYLRAVTNLSLNDIAITTAGNIVVMDRETKLIATFSPEEWSLVRGSNKYSPLTNSNLLWLRKNQTLYAYNNELLQVVENGIGLDQIHKMIKDRLWNIGSSTTSSDLYIPKEAAQGTEILKLMLLYGPKGYYKITTELSSSSQNLVEAALTYIYSTLPANAKARLAFETKTGSLELVLDLIKSLIFSTVDSTTKYSTLYLGTDDKLTKGKSSGSEDSSDLDDLKMNVALKWLAGYGVNEHFIINLGDKSGTLVSANTMPLVKMNGDNLGAASTLQAVSEGLYQPILNLRSVTMGGQLIDPLKFSLIVLTDGKISSIDFPCIEENGVIRPDLSLETRKNKAAADLELLKMGISITTEQDIAKNYKTINSVYEKHNLKRAYNEYGKLMPGSWARFGVINAKASNGALGMGQFDHNPLLLEDTDDDNIKNYITIAKDEDWDSNNFLWNGVDHLYAGTVWIPVQVDYNAAAASLKISAEEALRMDALDLARKNRSEYNKPPVQP